MNPATWAAMPAVATELRDDGPTEGDGALGAHGSQPYRVKSRCWSTPVTRRKVWFG